MKTKYLLIPLIIIIAVLGSLFYINEYHPIDKISLGSDSASSFSLPSTYKTNYNNSRDYVQIKNGTNKINIHYLNNNSDTLDQSIEKYNKKYENKTSNNNDLVVSENLTAKKIVFPELKLTQYWFSKKNKKYSITIKNETPGTDNTVKEIIKSIDSK